MFFFSFYGLQGIGHYAAWRRALSLPPGLGNIDIIGHRGVVVKQAQIIRVSSIILDSTCNQTGESTVSPKTTVREPRCCYPEILQGPERTNVKGAHVTHFYPKILSPDHPNFLGRRVFFGGKLPATHTVQTQ